MLVKKRTIIVKRKESYNADEVLSIALIIFFKVGIEESLNVNNDDIKLIETSTIATGDFSDQNIIINEKTNIEKGFISRDLMDESLVSKVFKMIEKSIKDYSFPEDELMHINKVLNLLKNYLSVTDEYVNNVDHEKTFNIFEVIEKLNISLNLEDLVKWAIQSILIPKVISDLR